MKKRRGQEQGSGRLKPVGRPATVEGRGQESTNWQIRKAIDYALFKIWNLTIELKWHDDRIKNPEPKIIIQGSYIKNLEKAMECLDFILENARSYIKNLEKALECLDFILENARMITELSINIGINNGTRYLEPLLTKFLNRENVSLEILKIRRRYIGETFPIISDLIYENSETLRIIGKIGLQEAVESFTDKIKLERLSLMNFDLITDDI
uniref:Uncharacterized protein n=1 Tax=Panagrolaimus sp. JU765 TaxID=591449 RepID=A0AC34Q6H8_9BILA